MQVSQISTLSANLTNNVNSLTAQVSEERTARANAIAAEAAERNAIRAQITGGYAGNNLDQLVSGLLYAERQARVASDSAQVTQINALSASLANNVNTLTAQISEERAARLSALAAEASDRIALRTQITGGYTGSDLGQLTSGLLYQERVTRATQDAALAQQISLLTADVGGGFDPIYTWYFDGGVDGW